MTKSISLTCAYCHKTFSRSPKQIAAGRCKKSKLAFCSPKCSYASRAKKQLVECKQCHKQFIKQFNQIQLSPNNFCGHSCAATWNNHHIERGLKRSQFEAWVQQRIVETFPELEVQYNRKKAIESELDIYIPSLKLAIEISGVHHFFPLFGQAKLEAIQRNDAEKVTACQERGIKLVVINICDMKSFACMGLETHTNEIIKEIKQLL